MKFLLGGIPLGCDNVGDEAILSCAVQILHRNFPDCEITVCTAKPENTARLLPVRTVPLYGFDSSASLAEFRKLAAQHDFYFWAGATGLSDYPETAVRLLRQVRKAGIPAIVWGVGMDRTLNPAFFQLRGKRRLLLQGLTCLSFGKINFIARMEQLMDRRIRVRLGKELEACLLVVVRDRQTQSELIRSGFHHAETGADSAVILETGRQEWVVREPGIRKIGICISAQRKIQDASGLRDMLDRLLENPANRVVFIPMNPETDRDLMRSLQQKLRKKEQSYLLENCPEPEKVQSVASCCDVIVSSRLHLLILAANVHTPIIGISRGSKVDNFLDNFGYEAVGSVDHCDFEALYRRIQELLADSGIFRIRSEEVHARLLERLHHAEQLLRQTVFDYDRQRLYPKGGK